MEDTARRLLSCGCEAVLVKGGHRAGAAADVLVSAGRTVWFEAERQPNPHTHGTGCSFSAALLAELVKGAELEAAVGAAKAFIAGAIAQAQRFGHGINPVNHFWETQPRFGAVDN
jgi:hydroxymethylpyrimidine/phosphomethylpyrimidine kinase